MGDAGAGGTGIRASWVSLGLWEDLCGIPYSDHVGYYGIPIRGYLDLTGTGWDVELSSQIIDLTTVQCTVRVANEYHSPNIWFH